MTSKVAIVGTVGIPACYGGFESLVDNLVKNNNSGVEYTVFCSSKYYSNQIKEYVGARLIYIPLNANGVSSIIYDIYSFVLCLKKKYDVVLVLGVSGCIFLPVFKFFSKATIITNIDGLEWRRQKWGNFAKWFLKLSEKIAVNYSDIVISDNEAIGNYVFKEYGVRSEIISYGGDHSQRDIIKENCINSDPYYFSLCRIEPENNVHTILKGFSKSNEKIKFVGNWNASEYGVKLKEEYSSYSNIELIDPVYDLDTLYSYRSQCKGYIHGHSAGGTNPSLVEAMHFGKKIIAFDCEFNRYTTEDLAQYFLNSDDLNSIISTNDLDCIGDNMKKIAERKYTWKIISSQYASLFDGRSLRTYPQRDCRNQQ